MKRLLVLAGALAGGACVLGVAHAGEAKTSPKAVLELFTSQGCSSCPPADELLARLGRDPGIVALAYHVDYWDYIGWPDTFGSRANTRHQRDYAAAWNSNRIYTPQLIINGVNGLVGSHDEEVEGAVAKASLSLPVSLAADDGALTIDIRPDAVLEPASIWLVTYIDDAPVKVDRGENGGKTIDYTHVVTGRQVIGMWDPENGAHLKLPLADVLGPRSNGAAILVQQDRKGLPGRILGAASYVEEAPDPAPSKR